MQTVEVILYMEAYCPYCNYVHKYILRDLQIRRDEINRRLRVERLPPIPPIDIRVVDVNVKHDEWYETYSKKVGGRYTPVINIKDAIFYLFGKDKPTTLQQKHLSATSLLKSQIIEKLQQIVTSVEKEPSPEVRVIPELPKRVVGKAGVPAFWRY